MTYAEFKQKCIERTDSEGYILDNYTLHIDGNEVNFLLFSKNKHNEDYIRIVYRGGYSNEEIYEFEVDENNEYLIEWFILEK